MKHIHSPLATPSATRAVLEKHDINLKHSLGQNFLVNDDVIGKILDLSKVAEDDFVLEVGPGIGTLTCALLERAHALIAIERDPVLPSVLADTLARYEGKFAIVEKDALDICVDDLEDAVESLHVLEKAGSGASNGIENEPDASVSTLRDATHAHQRRNGLGNKIALPNKLVSNLPYSVAATIVLDYFERFDSIKEMTVMVQREVAERMMAKPGSKDYGAYTIKLSMYAEFGGFFSVGPGNFMPPPHVDSTVIKLDRKLDSGLSAELLHASCTMADAAFAARRKTISNSCKQYFAGRDARIAANIPLILEEAGVAPNLRGEALSPNRYLDLGRALLQIRV